MLRQITVFDADTGLFERAAPGEALIFALDGEGVIEFEGKDHPVQDHEGGVKNDQGSFL